jgi:hypothetical protein
LQLIGHSIGNMPAHWQCMFLLHSFTATAVLWASQSSKSCCCWRWC